MSYNIENSTCLDDSHILCPFRAINGSLVCIVSLVGFVLCLWIVYNIVSGEMRLSGVQNIFILNVLFCDTIIAVIGVIRGLGILSKWFVGVSNEGQVNDFCYIYPMASQLFWNSNLLVLVPLTIDRFTAVMFPFKHQAWFTVRNSLLLIGFQWVVVLSEVVCKVVFYHTGALTMEYQVVYHRCSFNSHPTFRKLETIMVYASPTLVLVILYTIMFTFIIRQRKSCRKLLTTSVLICTCSVFIAVPHIMISSGFQMSYEAAQVLTVTTFYTTAVFDPIIYYCTNPAVNMPVVSQLVSAIRRYTLRNDKDRQESVC